MVLIEVAVLNAEGIYLAASNPGKANKKHKEALDMLTVQLDDMGKIQFNGLNFLKAVKRTLLLLKQFQHAVTVAKEIRAMIRPPKHVVICLDYSGSMNCTGRIEGALRNIQTIFRDHVMDNDRLSFITFNDRVKVHFGNERKHINHLNAMKRMQNPDGATAWRDALAEAVKLKSGDGVERMTKYIVFLTDGTDTCSKTSQRELERLIGTAENTNLVVIGLMMDDMSRCTVCLVDTFNSLGRNSCPNIPCICPAERAEMAPGRVVTIPRRLTAGKNNWKSFEIVPPKSWEGSDLVTTKDKLKSVAHACLETGTFIDADNAGDQLDSAFAAAAAQMDRGYGISLESLS